MKESYYFPHDYDAQNDPKLQALISNFKAEGYGTYWAIIEMLHKEESHSLPLKKYIYAAIAKQMLISAEQVEAIISFAINECELFIKKDKFFTSIRVLRNFDKRAKIREKRSVAGKLGNFAKQSLAKNNFAKQKIILLSKTTQRKGKERKGKEKKGKENKIKENKIIREEELSPEKSFLIAFEKPNLEKVLVFFNSAGYEKNEAEKFWSYYDSTGWETSKGQPIKYWTSKVLGWMNNSKQFSENENGSNKKNNIPGSFRKSGDRDGFTILTDEFSSENREAPNNVQG